MKTLLLTTVIFLLSACGGNDKSNAGNPSSKKNSSSTSSPRPHIPPLVMVEESKETSTTTFQTYELSILEDMGIHFLGKSNLTNLGNPAVIYCSNTEFQNQEKIEELEKLKIFLSQQNAQLLTYDKIILPKAQLEEMITRSILTLESQPYTQVCPKIYLSL